MTALWYQLHACHAALRTASTAPCAAYLGLGGIVSLPGSLHLILQLVDGDLLLLAEAQRGLYLGRIGHDLRVELAAFLDEPDLIVCRTSGRDAEEVSDKVLCAYD